MGKADKPKQMPILGGEWTLRRLKPKQRRFVEEYLVDLNATQAAIRAGYSAKTAREIGAENLTKPIIQAALKEVLDGRMKSCEISGERVLREIARIALSDIRAAYNEEGKLKRVVDFDDEFAPAVAGIEVSYGKYGKKTSIKLWDKGAAHDKLGKYLKLWSDHVEIAGLDNLADAIRAGRERAEQQS